MESQITSVHIDDVQDALKLTDEQVSLITQEDLDEIADRMRDDYVNQLFWNSLKILGEDVLKDILETQDEEGVYVYSQEVTQYFIEGLTKYTDVQDEQVLLHKALDSLEVYLDDIPEGSTLKAHVYIQSSDNETVDTTIEDNAILAPYSPVSLLLGATAKLFLNDHPGGMEDGGEVDFLFHKKGLKIKMSIEGYAYERQLEPKKKETYYFKENSVKYLTYKKDSFWLKKDFLDKHFETGDWFGYEVDITERRTPDGIEVTIEGAANCLVDGLTYTKEFNGTNNRFDF